MNLKWQLECNSRQNAPNRNESLWAYYARPRLYSFISLLVIFLLNASLAFHSNIPGIDEVPKDTTNITNPVHCLHASEALDRLGTVICSMTPESLSQWLLRSNFTLTLIGSSAQILRLCSYNDLQILIYSIGYEFQLYLECRHETIKCIPYPLSNKSWKLPSSNT